MSGLLAEQAPGLQATPNQLNAFLANTSTGRYSMTLPAKLSRRCDRFATKSAHTGRRPGYRELPGRLTRSEADVASDLRISGSANLDVVILVAHGVRLP
jgi:hypothetical protein